MHQAADDIDLGNYGEATGLIQTSSSIMQDATAQVLAATSNPALLCG